MAEEKELEGGTQPVAPGSPVDGPRGGQEDGQEERKSDEEDGGERGPSKLPLIGEQAKEAALATATTDNDDAARSSAEAATKAMLQEAAAAAKALALATLEASKEATASAAAEKENASRRGVPAVAARIVQRHEPALCTIVLECDASAVSCARGMATWQLLRESILDEPGDDETYLEDDSLSREEILTRFRLAVHLVVEVLDSELHILQERFLVKQALPMISGASLIGILSTSEIAKNARRSGEEDGPAASRAHSLAAYVVKLVHKYCSSPPEEGSIDDGKKKRTKKGGDMHPRPVNHPVLSSPLVLKSAPDFHPINAKVT